MLFIMMCVSVDDRNQSKNLTYGHFLPLHLRFPKERTLYPALVIHTHIKQGGDFFGPRSPLIFQFSNPSFQLSFLKSHFSNTITSQLTLLKNIRFSLLNTHFSTHSYLLRFVSTVACIGRSPRTGPWTGTRNLPNTHPGSICLFRILITPIPM